MLADLCLKQETILDEKLTKLEMLPWQLTEMEKNENENWKYKRLIQNIKELVIVNNTKTLKTKKYYMIL